jgi:hypothetical protein
MLEQINSPTAQNAVGHRVRSADFPLSAYSVEKLFSLNSARATGKIDLSDRSRIDDHSPAKGSSTPKKEVFITVDEFFNRIGQELSLAGTASGTASGLNRVVRWSALR